MIYIVIIFLIVGVWQMFMWGRKSEMISGASFWLAIILLAVGFVIGKIEVYIGSLFILGLVSFFILNYIIRRFKFYENLRIREIIYEYRDFKEKNLGFNEDQLCRLTVADRLRRHYVVYELRDNSDKQIKSYMDDIFKEELNLKYVCMWFMEHEYPKYSMSNNSHNLSDWREKNKELENRIEYYLQKIPNL